MLLVYSKGLIWVRLGALRCHTLRFSSLLQCFLQLCSCGWTLPWPGGLSLPLDLSFRHYPVVVSCSAVWMKPPLMVESSELASMLLQLLPHSVPTAHGLFVGVLGARTWCALEGWPDVEVDDDMGRESWVPSTLFCILFMHQEHYCIHYNKD